MRNNVAVTMDSALQDEVLTMDEAAVILKMKPREVCELTRQHSQVANGDSLFGILNPPQGEVHSEV